MAIASWHSSHIILLPPRLSKRLPKNSHHYLITTENSKKKKKRLQGVVTVAPHLLYGTLVTGGFDPVPLCLPIHFRKLSSVIVISGIGQTIKQNFRLLESVEQA